MNNFSNIPGAILRARRQELGLTLDEVADRTRIRRTYLEALEEERTDAFPGEAYRVGFLRTYAGLLGLKPEKIQEAEAVQPAPKLIQQQPARPVQQPTKPPPGSAGSVRSSSSSPMATPMATRGSRPARRRKGKGIYAVAAAAVLVVGAIVSAYLLQGPEPAPAPAPAPVALPTPPPVPAPAPAPAPLQGTEGIPPAQGTPGEEIAGAPTAAEGNGSTTDPAGAAPAVGTPAPAPEAGKPQATTEAAVPAPAPEPAPIPAPSKVNVLRLQALGTNRLELILDNRAPQSYEVKTDTQLSWKVRRSALIRVDDPSTVKLWFGDKPVDLNGRTQILVQAGMDPGQDRQ